MRARAALVLAATALGLLLWTESAIAATGSSTVVHRGPGDRKQVALTFDGAYALHESLAVLRTLQSLEVPATLFLIGSSLHSFPEISAEIVNGMAAGLFEVGDHTWSHPDLTKLTTAAMAGQIGKGAEAFGRLTGARAAPLFRPPYGATNARVAEAAGIAGYRHLVMWSVDPKDWDGRPAAAITRSVLGKVDSGSIVLLHLSGRNTAAALPAIVSTLRARGYELVTVSKLLKGDRLFLDVDPAGPVGQAVARLVGDGIVSGYDGNYFGPADTITRAQVAKIATLVGGVPVAAPCDDCSQTFSDVPLLRDPSGRPLAYPFAFVEAAAAAGLVLGRAGPLGEAVFDPGAAITRVQLAQMLARMARELKGHSEAPGGAGAAEGAPVFTDVPEYAAADVALVSGLGLMVGLAGDRFEPWAGAQRGHVALAMTRYLDLAEPAPGAGPVSSPHQD